MLQDPSKSLRRGFSVLLDDRGEVPSRLLVGTRDDVEADTLDKVDPQDFRKNMAALAVMGYVLADMPGRLHSATEPRP